MSKNLFFIPLMFLSIAAYAQRPDAVKTYKGNDAYACLENKEIEELYKLYSGRIESSYDFICGREHYPYYFNSESKPILFYGKKHSSLITIKGRTYNNYSLNYDTNKDQLIYLDTINRMAYRPFGMALNRDNINNFVFAYKDDTLSFRFFSKDDDPTFNLPDGFYQVVYYGTSKYLIKYISSAVIHGSDTEYFYSPVGFLNTGKGYVKVKMNSQFIRQFGASSRDIRKYMSRTGIKFRRADKRELNCVLKYYDNLAKK
ncbi:MAG TPA: hypothetical protein PLR88_10190 [Bacteroidales bacterium]|nr:hypothetical protein [Bacteroidales bacterium]HPT22305.1 hypothetical protein [Bacteroidales bacterium]